MAVSSQNGYLFMFDLAQRKFVFSEKIHIPGIEGLIWEKGIIATCSSDQ